MCWVLEEQSICPASVALLLLFEILQDMKLCAKSPQLQFPLVREAKQAAELTQACPSLPQTFTGTPSLAPWLWLIWCSAFHAPCGTKLLLIIFRESYEGFLHISRTVALQRTVCSVSRWPPAWGQWLWLPICKDGSVSRGRVPQRSFPCRGIHVSWAETQRNMGQMWSCALDTQEKEHSPRWP